jgi:hypothetical protein
MPQFNDPTYVAQDAKEKGRYLYNRKNDEIMCELYDGYKVRFVEAKNQEKGMSKDLAEKLFDLNAMGFD